MDTYYNLCFVINDNYVGQFKVTFYSIFLNNKDKKFNINIIESDLSNESKNDLTLFISQLGSIINFIDVDNSWFTNASHMATDSSYTTYYKIFIFKYLINLDRVLYLDCDMVVNNDIDELYNYNTDKLLCAVIDREVNKCNRRYLSKIINKNTNYFNAGMLLFNFTDENRKLIDLELIKNYLLNESSNLQMHDQDVFNHFFNENCTFISNKYNYFTLYHYLYQFFIPIPHNKKPTIIHYVGFKPWKGDYVGFFKNKYIAYYKETSKVTNINFLEKTNHIGRIKKYFILWRTKLHRLFNRIFHL